VGRSTGGIFFSGSAFMLARASIAWSFVSTSLIRVHVVVLSVCIRRVGTQQATILDALPEAGIKTANPSTQLQSDNGRT
jgi:hypothetical protein